MEIAIKAEKISKKFCKSLRHTMLYGTSDIAKSFLGLNSKSNELRKGEFWAIDNISFEIKKGEVLGIIGPNGSGKSTILKLLNGIFMPDSGKIEINGSVGALIEVGAGFHPMLTGRENIYINASILGLKKKEIDAKFDEIVSFADIGNFIDAPVKHYSSGMFVRLGFSVAIHSEPDIILVDEILSVGDASFRIKSMNKMLDIVNSGATVCFVSHDLMGVEHICDRVIWLQKGKIEVQGNKEIVLDKYLMSQRIKAIEDMERNEVSKKGLLESNMIWVTKCKILNENNVERDELGIRDRLIVRIHYEVRESVEHPYFMVYVVNFEGQTLFCSNMLADGGEPDIIDRNGYVDVDFGNPSLVPGAYMVKVQIRRDSTIEHYSIRTVAKFNVVASPDDYGYIGKFKNVYTYGIGIAQPYEYRWNNISSS